MWFTSISNGITSFFFKLTCNFFNLNKNGVVILFNGQDPEKNILLDEPKASYIINLSGVSSLNIVLCNYFLDEIIELCRLESNTTSAIGSYRIH